MELTEYIDALESIKNRCEAAIKLALVHVHMSGGVVTMEAIPKYLYTLTEDIAEFSYYLMDEFCGKDS